MGEIISIGDSLVITIFSMVVVFAILVLIAWLIGALKVISNGKEQEKPVKVEEPKAKEPVIEAVQEGNDEELVAVIAAAVAASLGLSIPEVNIKTIRRVPQSTTPWAITNKNEQIFNRL